MARTVTLVLLPLLATSALEAHAKGCDSAVDSATRVEAVQLAAEPGVVASRCPPQPDRSVSATRCPPRPRKGVSASRCPPQPESGVSASRCPPQPD